jgi:hypothetical protein
MEYVEWCVFALVVLFVLGVLALRHEITVDEPENAAAPVHSLQE